ncbi:MAG: hypothetical protein LUH63_07165 [Parabacteroides sp.]|nr:hypothetical protein [Parabacteroides sp.]
MHYDSRFTVTAEQISGVSTKVDNINRRIDAAGWITKAEGNYWWASSDLEDGDTLISYINQTSTSTSIKSERIDLIGKVSIRMFDRDLNDQFSAKVNSSSLGDMAYKSKVEKAQLGATLFDGAHIITSLIDADSIYANMASIGGFKN